MLSNGQIVLEQEILGSLFKNEDLIIKAKEKIKPEMFLYSKHMNIYLGILEMVENKMKVELITFLEYHRGKINEMDGVTYVSEIFTCSISDFAFNTKMDLLIDNYKKHLYIEMASRINEDMSFESIESEIENVKSLGVKIETNVVIGKSMTIDQLIEEEGFEAVFIGSGAGLPRFMGIPGENANGVFSANEYLTRSNLMKAFNDDYDTPIARFNKVAIVGGGNVAMDAARTALRLGAEVHIVYRRSEAELPARAEEVHHAKEEGIIFDLLTNPTEIIADENGWVKGMKCVKMELGEPDASGRRRPVEVPGSEYVMDLDAVIMSLGTSPNPLISSTTKGLDINNRKCIIAEEETGKTTKTGVYAGGDAVTGAATVILAMGAGKAGAKGIDEYLSNK